MKFRIKNEGNDCGGIIDKTALKHLSFILCIVKIPTFGGQLTPRSSAND